ncbi:MAG: RimK family alpha-L-glutamate ligase [Rikenellaceae bacterium]|nr:RimK family alpha-L-glutamate ligase [Rikenellaceae bacterium]
MTKRVMMIYPRKSLRDNGFEWLKKEGVRAGFSVETVIDDTLSWGVDGGASLFVDGVRCDLPDMAVMRHYDTAISLSFERLGVRTVNTSVSMSLSYNKGLTHVALSSAGIPMPETLWGASVDYDRAAGMLGLPFVLKSAVGSKGERVWLVSSRREYDARLPLCEGGAVAQRYVFEASGRDIRVWVVGGRAVAAVRRVGSGDFRSNYSLGGSVEPYALTPEVASLAVSASQTLGLEFSGVDIMESAHGPLVCEVNGNAGFRSVSALGTADIPAELFAYLASVVR